MFNLSFEHKMNIGETGYKNCSMEGYSTETINSGTTNPFYNIFLFQGRGKVSIDFTDYDFNGNIVLFTTPFQLVRFNMDEHLVINPYPSIVQRHINIQFCSL